MPYTTVVPSTTITAAWGNAAVRDQVVTPFASAAARSSAITAAIEGMISVRSDVHMVETYNGAAWAPVQALFMGQTLGIADVTFTAGTLIDQVTFTALANRRYLLVWSAAWYTSDTGQVDFALRHQAGATLTTGGTLIGTARRQEASTNVWMDVFLARSVTGIPAGQTSIGVTGARSSGAGADVAVGGANFQRVAEVYDIGPA